MAALLILGDNVRHVLQDLDVWPAGPWPGSSQYVSNCPARIAMSPPRPCNTSAECGTFDCGGDSYAASDGASCFSCYQWDGVDIMPVSRRVDLSEHDIQRFRAVLHSYVLERRPCGQAAEDPGAVEGNQGGRWDMNGEDEVIDV
eukprot:756632-Hanusia_phi.AAC.4